MRSFKAGFRNDTCKRGGMQLYSSVPGIEEGVGYLPEDRQQQGLILSWELYRNMTLSTLDKYNRLIGIDTGRNGRRGGSYVRSFRSRPRVYFPERIHCQEEISRRWYLRSF